MHARCHEKYVLSCWNVTDYRSLTQLVRYCNFQFFCIFTSCHNYFSGTRRVSYRGEGGLEFSPPSHSFPYPEIMKLSMVIILAIHVTERKYHQNVRKFCPRLCQKQSERCINSKFSWGGGGGGGVPPDPPSRSHTTIILLPSCFPPPPPNSKSYMKP